MADKFKNKYRNESHRKPGWDYSSDGHYFINLVVQHRYQVLGIVENGKMILNAWGEIVLNEWNKSFVMRAELFCDTFIIMPNHLHAIVTIDNNAVNNVDLNKPVGSHGRATQRILNDKSPKWERKPKSISSFVAGFKSAINTAIDNEIDNGGNLFPNLGKFNRNNHFWQPNYHDHIIRNEKSFENISNYIINNPAKWVDEGFYGNE